MYLWRKGIPMNHFFKSFNICCIKVKVKSFIDFELWISSISFMVPWGLGFGHLHWGLWRWELSFLSTTGMHSRWKKLSTASNLVGRPVRADDSTGSRFHYQGDAPLGLEGWFPQPSISLMNGRKSKLLDIEQMGLN